MTAAILILILCIIVLILSIRLRSLHQAMDRLTKELREINQETPAHRHLQVPVPDPHLEKLAEEINRCLTQSFSRIYSQKQREQDIRREITNISHDLRTPLTSILGYLELIEEDTLSPEQSEYLEIVQKRSRHLNMLTSQLYEYARLEAKELPLHTESIDLTAVLKEHLLSFYQEFENRGLTLTPCLPETSVMISGDKDALERVLHNLTSNMLRYGFGNARITLEGNQTQAVVTYVNQVAGLTEEDVSHLFDPFYTADQARTSRRSGLGMTVAKLLAEQMGGSIEAELDNDSLKITCRLPLCIEENC
ncbi:HAMP domain-containing histidine kinase [Blautia schinkii]|nr:HAMP domain-containing histidine kinase [Blautia schinkii]